MVELSGSVPSVSKTTLDLIQLFDPIRADLDEVEREYLRQVESKVGVIPEIGAYIQKSGGKRVRPAVLLMAARLCGYTGHRAVLNAAVVEFIHTATLVHDDIIDDAEIRRGQKAVHSRWGNDVTVLAGDFLYIKSMAMALTQDTLDVVRLLCDITLRMIEGEIYQLTKNGDIDISEDEHFDIIRRKTAHLFGGCAEIGAMLGDAGAEKQAALREYGFALGTMFQLVDDQLDFTGEAEALGKPIGGDLLEGKMTLPLIHLRDHAGPEAIALIRRIVHDRYASAEDWARLRHMMADHRSLDYARARAIAFGEAAKRQLAVFPDRPERDALMALADYVVSRDR
jgi:octaprenyl-diphosphate synthase